eukprot:3822973-Prymnesium_polylepis.1
MEARKNITERGTSFSYTVTLYGTTMADSLKPPRETGLVPLRRPDRRGFAPFGRIRYFFDSALFQKRKFARL